MGCSKISALAMVAVVVMTVATTVAEGQTSTPSCASKLVPCATFLNSSSTERPLASCCDPFREAVTKEMNCLCNLYNTPGLLASFGINITQFLLLPGRCNIPRDLDACLKDTLRVGQVLRDWECLRSSNDQFRLQFFSLDASSSRYLGIRYIYINNGRYQAKAVWVANPNVPITDSSGNLTITHDGYLMLNNYRGKISTVNAEQPAMSSNTSATLLDTGNLVLRAGERIVWQSFDHPFDTWLPGMNLGMFSLNTGEPQYRFLTSFASLQVPAPGAFTLGVDPNNTKQLVIWRRGVPYWRSGTWNGYNFSYFPDAKTYDLFSEFSFRYFSNESQSYFNYTRDTKNSITPWIGMGSSGEIDMGQLSEDEKLSLHHAIDPCAADQAGNWSMGCATPPEPSNCKAGNEFIKTNGTMDVWYRSKNLSLDISDCKDICTRNCSCTAYASEIADGSGCKFSWGQLQLDNQGEIFYIRKSSLVTKEGVVAGAKAAVVATIATAIPTLASVRMLPWARANLNHTAQALIISTVAGAAYFIVADKTVLASARRNSFKQGSLPGMGA